jgi:diadenosine tetraphosphate (Ap4A) HIT family hydrolase
MSLERLWAGWRGEYVSGLTPDGHPGECVFCRIIASDDDEAALVLERTERTIAVMNLYPYGSGHLMIAPLRHVGSIEDLDDNEVAALARAQQRAVVAIRAAFRPDGINLGANLGRAAGAGVPDHVHVHALPRWAGDTNFMTSVAEARVLPEPLSDSYHKLRANWPDQ